MKEVIVRSFGARLLGGKAQEDHATSIFLAQNRLWNSLVEVERDARQAYHAALRESDQGYADLMQKADEQQLVIDALLAARNKERAAARSKKTDNAASYTNRIKEESGKLKQIRAEAKECRARAKEAAKPLIEAAELRRRERVKEVSKPETTGLWWCHSETVLAKYDVARVRAMKEGAELRFHRFDRNGSMGVRFTVKGGSLGKMFAGSTDLFLIRDPAAGELGPKMLARKSDGGRRVVMEVRAGAKGEGGSIPKLTFLVTMQAGMELPQDVPLKTVTIKREMHVDKPEWKLVMVFSHEAEPEAQVDLPEKVVGIDFGWRLTRTPSGERHLRVAALSFGPQEPVRFVSLDEDWLHRMDRADRLRGDLDDSANKFAAVVLPLLSTERVDVLEDSWFKVLAGKAKRAKRAYPSLLIELCTAHADGGNPLGAEAAELMDTWRREAVSLAREAHHCRRRAVDHRKHIFRNVASQLSKQAGLLGIKDIDLKGLALKVKPDGTDSELHQLARKHRAWAASSELRLAIEQVAKRERLETVSVPSPGTSSVCCACGHENPSPGEDLMFVCQGCGKVWDQDENASHNCREFALREAESSAGARS